MLRSIFISLLLLWGSSLPAQLVQEPVSRPQGFTLGVNLAGPLNKLLDGDRTGISFLTRMHLTEDWFFIGEAGFENVSFTKEAYDYESNGTFLRLGLARDMLPEKEAGSMDNILMGLQYGYALQEQTAGRFSVFNGYWDDYHSRVGANTLNTHWAELSVGPRAEVFHNFYLSWQLNLRVVLVSSNSSALEPYIVPGYGIGDNKVNLGFAYTLEYFIPWKK